MTQKTQIIKEIERLEREKEKAKKILNLNKQKLTQEIINSNINEELARPNRNTNGNLWTYLKKKLSYLLH